MAVQDFDAWAAKLTKALPLYHLKGSVIGCDAAHFLRSIQREPLLSALGGSPLALGSKIAEAVTHLREAGLVLHFVFNGLDFGVKSDPFTASASTTQIVDNAFELYESKSAPRARNVFEAAGAPDPIVLTRTFQKTLHEIGVPFTVAPYSALAQLAYYERHTSQFVDAVYGPSELFCFGVDKLITKFERPPDTTKTSSNGAESLERTLFHWIDRRACLEALGNVPVHVFVDGLLLTGSNLLPTFPPLTKTAVYKEGEYFRDAVEMIGTAGGSVSRLCARDPDPAVKEVYLDQYKRAIASARHHIVITADGDVEAMDKEHAPSDAHEYIGLRLPEELYMYLSRGMIQPRVLNWSTSGAIYVTAPVAGGDGASYQDLVRTQLDLLRRQALSLLAEPIHRYYQTREITTKIWFDRGNERKSNSKSLQPSPRETLSGWNVKQDLLQEITTETLKPGTFSFAIRGLSNAEFAAKTITPKPKGGQRTLKGHGEVLANATWRFLQLRGYVNKQHQLTTWGKVLETALVASGPPKELEEAVFIAVELMRLGLVIADTMFPNYAGAPINGSITDRRNCMLISRVACLGKIRHQPRGYSGPLSRHLLAYQATISNVQTIIRDLLEMNLAAMFLEGLVDRDRDDWFELSSSLPLYEQHSCALGVLTMHYLDHLCENERPTAEETRKEIKAKGQTWIRDSDFSRSLDDAFHIWDAVYQAVKTAGEEVKNTSMWDEVDEWLSHRR